MFWGLMDSDLEKKISADLSDIEFESSDGSTIIARRLSKAEGAKTPAHIEIYPESGMLKIKPKTLLNIGVITGKSLLLYKGPNLETGYMIYFSNPYSKI